MVVHAKRRHRALHNRAARCRRVSALVHDAVWPILRLSTSLKFVVTFELRLSQAFLLAAAGQAM